MLPVMQESYGNPSSSHAIGQRAAFLVAQARREVASCFGADPSEIVFTSGGTESDNIAILGALRANPTKRHIVTTKVEHEAVYRFVEHLEREGYEATYLDVGQDGRLDLNDFRAALRDDTCIASIMAANNETGVLSPLEQIGEICRERNALFHTDAVQAIGKIPIDVRRLQIDLLSMSAHKFHGPKGIGALYIRKPLRIGGLIVGGQQEGDIRGGTENVPGIVGLGVAARLVEQESEQVRARTRALRDRLERELCQMFSFAGVIGGSVPRLPNTAMVAFRGFTAEAILIGLSEENICASGGSACHSGALEPSRVLQAMGVERELAVGAIRFSLSRYSTAGDIDRVLAVLPGVFEKIGSGPRAASVTP
jgi:cysteine desulfurase